MPVRPRVYVRRVLILRLVFNALARAKLAARGITTREIEEVVANGPHVRDNPYSRVPGSIYAIGPTGTARFLTIVLQPDDADPTRWHVMTGWDSDPRQIADYQFRR
jgi:hypothetical protein